MKLRTTLQLASFFPIFMAALFLTYLFLVHATVGGRAGSEPADLPFAAAATLAVFALGAGWGFYRAGQRLVRQIGTLERMTDQVKRGVLKVTEPLPGGTREVSAVAEVFSQMVGELRGYLDLIAAHERLKRECDAALAAAEHLRATSVEVSGTLELLRRAEEGIIRRMLEPDLFLLSWLPQRILHAALGIGGDAATPAEAGMPTVRPDVLEVLRRLVPRSPSGDAPSGTGSSPAAAPGVLVRDALNDAVTLCRWTWEQQRPQAPVAVSVNGGPGSPFEVHAERRDLIQAFASVLVNAAEAMPDGGRVLIETRTDEHGTLSLSVTDTGQGMTDAVRARCQKPFFSTKEGRLGIGLTLAGRLVARCGGRLGVMSEKGKGTTVYMTFPRPRASAGDAAAAMRARGGWSLLLVDDDEASRQALATMLSKEGHHVTAVEDGAAAVLMLRQKRFDAVLTDHAMPIMSGEELAAAVKARHPDVPVIMVTAAAEELEPRRATMRGVDAILPKPVLRYDLVAALGRAMECVQSSNPPQAPLTP